MGMLGRNRTWPKSFWALLWLLSIAFALTPAGTVIRNQAVAHAGGERYLSNEVEVLVRPLCVPLLSPDGTTALPGQEARVSPGGYAYLPFLLTNGGNDRFSLRLSHLLGPRDWNPEEVHLYPDRDGDALPDPGASPLGEVSLAMGESLRLVLGVKAPSGASGTLLVSPVASCPEGQEDRENWARVVAQPGPALALQKGMPLEALPGQEVLVVLRVRNLGDREAQGVVVTDAPLPLPFVPGSASAPKGRVEYWDGALWAPSEPSGVRGVRLVLERLGVGEEAFLAFRLLVPPGTPPGFVENLARAEGPGGPGEARASLRVLPLYAHHLGPRGNPRALPGGEGSADDRQAQRGLEGQTLCFAHTLENAGTGQDTYDLRVEGLPQGVDFWWESPTGTPLGLPLSLSPGESRDFSLCLRPSAPVGFTARVVATSRATGASNATWDLLEVLPSSALTLWKEADPPSGTTLRPGQEVVYTLRIQNAFAPLRGARVEDALSPWLEFVEASHGGLWDSTRRLVVWNLDPLPLGETRLTLRARVREDTPDDTLVQNAFSLRAQDLNQPILSPPTRHPVFGVRLLLRKEVSPKSARVGDLLLYRLTLENPSPSPLTVRLRDLPPPGTAYEPGTALLGCGASKLPLEPRVQEGLLLWEGLELPGRGRICLEYKLRLLPGAPEELVNTAEAQGLSANGAATASGRAQALARLDPGPFALGGVLLGRVFLDLDGDGVFGKGDLPLPGARILLSNGTQALTDAMGRYAFRNLSGLHQVMLDPDSAPFAPLPLPEGLGEGYRKRVLVQGATVADFPLRVPQGSVRVLRATTLRMGPLSVEKRVVEVAGKALAELRVRSLEALPELTLRDPLPGGGERVFAFELFQGEEVLAYPLERPILTDPEVRWRYP